MLTAQRLKDTPNPLKRSNKLNNHGNTFRKLLLVSTCYHILKQPSSGVCVCGGHESFSVLSEQLGLSEDSSPRSC